MKKQDVSNYRKYYPPHHFIFLPLALALTIGSAFHIFKFPEHALEWTFITASLFLSLYLSIMLRQHYALGNQNRIVRLEMRLRYYELTQKRFETVESKLEFRLNLEFEMN